MVLSLTKKAKVPNRVLHIVTQNYDTSELPPTNLLTLLRLPALQGTHAVTSSEWSKCAYKEIHASAGCAVQVTNTLKMSDCS